MAKYVVLRTVVFIEIVESNRNLQDTKEYENSIVLDHLLKDAFEYSKNPDIQTEFRTSVFEVEEAN